MAEGWLRQIAGDRYEVFSAGTHPSVVNPLAIAAMRERDVDISAAAGHRSKSLDEFRQQPFEYVITVCDQAAEACPIFPGPAQRIHWSFPDPAAVQGSDAQRMTAFRTVRDAIEARLREWVADSAKHKDAAAWHGK